MLSPGLTNTHTHSAVPGEDPEAPGLCRSSLQLAEPLLLLQLDEDVPLIHHVHQLLEDLLLSLLILRCLQGICGSRGSGRAWKATSPDLLPAPCTGILSLDMLALTLLVHVTPQLLIKLTLLLL